MIKFASEIEGTITSIEQDNDGGAVMIVMGMTVVITPQAIAKHRIRTPTNKQLSRDQLVDRTPLPGRKNVVENQGFKGGTAIVKGNLNPATGKIEVDFNPVPDPAQNLETTPFESHPSVEVGPPENLILGPFTGDANAGILSVNGIPIKRLGADFPQDERLPGDPARNEFGFDIDIKSVPANAPVSVEGYLSDVDKVGDHFSFIGFNFVVDSPNLKLIVTDKPQVSITRVQARNNPTDYDLDIRGGITTPVGMPIGSRPTLTLSGKALGASDWTPIDDRVTGIRQLVPGGFATWRFRTVRPGTAPEKVQVSINDAPLQAEPPEEFVDITKE